MTLDKAIKLYEEKAEELREQAEHILTSRYGNYSACLERANEYEQLAKWLKELKKYRKVKADMRGDQK